LTTENELLWPSFQEPSDLAAVERVPLSERGLPASTYELVRRAAELWPDRPAVSVLPNAESFHTPFVRTFAELAGDVHRAAAVLAELGVSRGDAVAVISVNCAEMLPLLLAAEAEDELDVDCGPSCVKVAKSDCAADRFPVCRSCPSCSNSCCISLCALWLS